MNKNKGFSLMELVIVMAMIGILAAIAVPGMKSWRDAHKISSTAGSLRSIFELAKTEAIKSQTTVAVSFTTGTGTAGSYMVFWDNGATPEVYDAGELIISSGNVQNTVTLYAVNFPGTMTNVALINQMGLASGSGGNIRIRNGENTLFKQISLSEAGSTRVETSATGNDDTWID